MNDPDLGLPTWGMSIPYGYQTTIANNAWMTESEDRTIDRPRMYAQWTVVYQLLASRGIVHLVPTPADRMQDLVFVANLGITLDDHQAIVANFTAEGRQPETAVGRDWFLRLGYETTVCPYAWEGEAELKHLHDGIYIGGHGQRSDPAAYDWMTETYNVEIVPVEMTDEYLYHLDCTVLPITPTDTLICTDTYQREELDAIGKHTNIIPATVENALAGITNSVVLGDQILCPSHVYELGHNDSEYKSEVNKIRGMEDVCDDLGLEPMFVNVSEFLKGGALLSCLVLPLR